MIQNIKIKFGIFVDSLLNLSDGFPFAGSMHIRSYRFEGVTKFAVIEKNTIAKIQTTSQNFIKCQNYLIKKI
jgi:hypothetical protein